MSLEVNNSGTNAAASISAGKDLARNKGVKIAPGFWTETRRECYLSTGPEVTDGFPPRGGRGGSWSGGGGGTEIGLSG